MRRRQMVKKMLFWVSIVTIFIVLTFLVIFSASGYRMNWQRFTFDKTGLIILKGSDKNVIVKLNNKVVGRKLPIRLSYLMPGWYDVWVEKKGYKSWGETIDVESGAVYEKENILLFSEGGASEIVSDQNLINLLKETKIPDDIIIDEGEIRVDDVLVTRFSEVPKFVNWYNDRQHIIFQRGKIIGIIELDGNNDEILATLESDDNSVFRTIDYGRYLLYQDGLVTKKVRVR